MRIIEYDGSEDIHSILGSNTNAVVKFGAPWCAPCGQVDTVIEGIEEFESKDFVLIRVNVDDFPRLAEEFNVSSIPDMRTFQHHSQVGNLVGGAGPDVIKDFVGRIVDIK